MSSGEERRGEGVCLKVGESAYLEVGEVVDLHVEGVLVERGGNSIRLQMSRFVGAWAGKRSRSRKRVGDSPSYFCPQPP